MDKSQPTVISQEHLPYQNCRKRDYRRKTGLNPGPPASGAYESNFSPAIRTVKTPLSVIHQIFTAFFTTDFFIKTTFMPGHKSLLKT